MMLKKHLRLQLMLETSRDPFLLTMEQMLPSNRSHSMPRNFILQRRDQVLILNLMV